MIVAVGGEETAATFEQAEAFSIRQGRWINLPPLPTARHGLGVVAVGDVIYALAGGTEPGFSYSTANEALDLSGFAP